jgi:hypothetical protein
MKYKVFTNTFKNISIMSKKLILLLIVITAIFAGCKKYPDGPWLSLRSAKGRLYGTHTLTKYTVNGVDSLSLYEDSLSTSFLFRLGSYNETEVCDMSGFRKDGLVSGLYWFWSLEDHNKALLVTLASGIYGGGFCTGPFGAGRCPEWQILKLYADDIIMQTTYNGKEYLIELTGD